MLNFCYHVREIYIESLLGELFNHFFIHEPHCKMQKGPVILDSYYCLRSKTHVLLGYDYFRLVSHCQVVIHDLIEGYFRIIFFFCE